MNPARLRLDEADQVREREIERLHDRVLELERQRSRLVSLLVLVVSALALGGGPDALRWLAGWMP